MRGTKKRPTAATPSHAECVVRLFRGRYTPRLLIRVYRWCKANPGGRVVVESWPCPTFTAEGWLAWFRGKLAEKITAADPRRPTGRKAAEEYQTELCRLRPYVGTRLVCRQVAPVLGSRVRNAMAPRLARSRES